MMEARTCPSCGGNVEAGHPQGLCPECLLRRGLEEETTVPGVPLHDSADKGDPIRAALEVQLQAQYRIVRPLGSGGMGAVYLARDLTLDREVAIKVIKTASDTGELYDRFRREAKMAARLSHPNIVPLHAFGEVEGMPYFVMGYVRGESLAARLRREGRIPEDETRRIVAEIADALDHAHRQSIVHRDVKPDNVLLEDGSGRALLTDFGIAKAFGAGGTPMPGAVEMPTRSGSVVGTPHFMSPEQGAGHAGIDGRSDIYSLGVMAYAMLAGRLPFEGATAADVLSKHLTQEPPPLRSFAPAVSDATVEAVERCLAKDPGRRWPDARSLKTTLATTEETQLPAALQVVQGWGGTYMAIGLLWLFFAKNAGAPGKILLINAGILALGYIANVVRLRFEGIGMGQSQRAIWTEPVWWPYWYPRALRRPGNVWDRLPAGIRRLRWWLLLFCISFILFVAVDASAFVAVRVIGTLGLSLVGLLLLGQARRPLERKGLSGVVLQEVLVSMPPGRATFWSRPHIAVILAPPPRRDARDSDSPHEQLRSILRCADELSGPLRPLGAQAAVAARQLIASIGDADRELAELARNVEPGEEQRLVEKIESLTGVPAHEADYAPMRSLLEQQLELIRGLSARIEAVKATRNRRIEMLRNLALHLASLRARSTETPAEMLSLTDRVRALCEDIARV
jgi:Protein kinase domain